jgi:hypothetical protein
MCVIWMGVRVLGLGLDLGSLTTDGLDEKRRGGRRGEGEEGRKKKKLVSKMM